MPRLPGFRVFNGPPDLRNIRLREINYLRLMDIAGCEIYPGFEGNGPLEEHWKRDELLWAFKYQGEQATLHRLSQQWLLALCPIPTTSVDATSTLIGPTHSFDPVGHGHNFSHLS